MPPRLVSPQQQEIMLDFLEKNKQLMVRGLPAPGTMMPGDVAAARTKWCALAKKLNAEEGHRLSPIGWRKYWTAYSHKVKLKAEICRQIENGESNDRYTPLTEVELRVLAILPEKIIKHKNKPSSPDGTKNSTVRIKPKTGPVRFRPKTSNTPVHIMPVTTAVPIRPMGMEQNTTNPVVFVVQAGPNPPPKVKPERRTTVTDDTGMEALETSINYWEDALAAFSLGARGGVSGTLALTSPEEAEFCREIQDLLQNAYLLQERCELLFLDQRSVLFRSESGGGAGAAGSGGSGAGRRERLLSTQTASTRREHHSSAESFASAEDQVADLRDFDDLTDAFPELENLELYQAAVKQLEIGIPYRTLRTEVLQCNSDSEFLCKLHCLRQAFTLVFKDAAVWAWFVDAGRQVLTDLLLFADKEPKEFLVAYEEMVSWATDVANWSVIESELTSKGVKALTFYDVVLDYILLDAFEDLASPPSSVLAVVRNRWLSDGFKESALTTAVWSVIKAKRRYLQYPEGFMAHFYSISEHLLPVLVWGFLGPRERLRDVCEAFQSEIVGFIQDIFSFHKSRYTTVEDLAFDIMQHARSRTANITFKLADRNL